MDRKDLEGKKIFLSISKALRNPESSGRSIIYLISQTNQRPLPDLALLIFYHAVILVIQQASRRQRAQHGAATLPTRCQDRISSCMRRGRKEMHCRRVVCQISAQATGSLPLLVLINIHAPAPAP